MATFITGGYGQIGSWVAYLLAKEGEDQAYECENCKGQVKVKAGGNVPQCCGRTMKSIPLSQCTLSTTAEHSRFDEDDEPCDDGRQGP